jgi:protein-S-isoprenylcysteine O-methyltransferase Ste14
VNAIALFQQAAEGVSPPNQVTYRNWADVILIAIFIVFAIYKAIRLQKTTRLGWSMATYNVVLALLFFIGVFVIPSTAWPDRTDSIILTGGRISLVLAIIWTVYEVEMGRKRIRDGADAFGP